MKYLSVCSGIEAATVAWHPLGWKPVGFSEIEKFPSAVLQHHYPDVPNYGDMTDHERWQGICSCRNKYDGREGDGERVDRGSTNLDIRYPNARNRNHTEDGNCERCKRSIIDVLVGGTPCQSFSVAGLRQGMADPRGNLALVYLAIADQYRPDWLVWENVPGILSSNEGRDFGAIIGAMVELGYSPAWRVLDAQYFGVPQRRRRVFVVASARDWRDSAKVLFEPESLLRNPPPGRGEGQGTAPTLSARTKGGGGLGTDAEIDGALIPEVANPLTARMHKGINTTLDEGQTPIVCHGTQDPVNVVAFRENQRSEVIEDDVAGSLKVNGGKPGQGYPAIRQNMAVRRLTPLECERLQGFPDGYTAIPGGSDSGRYKALGNSMAVPVMQWIGRRIDQVDKERKE